MNWLWYLIGGLAIILAAAGGIGYVVSRMQRPHRGPVHPPAPAGGHGTPGHAPTPTGGGHAHSHEKKPMTLFDLTLRWGIGGAVVFALIFGIFWLARVDRQDSYDAKAREEDRKVAEDREWRASMVEYCGSGGNPDCQCFDDERPARVLRPGEEARLNTKGRTIGLDPLVSPGVFEICNERGSRCTTDSAKVLNVGVTMLLRNLTDKDLPVKCRYIP